MLEPLVKTRLYEEIVKQIVDRIKSGDLKPGDKLPTERELAAQLKVSRTAIREALRSLEVMGLIDSKVGSGTYVREVSLDSLMDAFAGILKQNERMVVELIEVRMLLEVEIAKLAAKRRTEDNLRAIENALELIENEIEQGELGFEGDNAFHEELTNAAGNLALSSIHNLCGELLSSTRKAALMALDSPMISLEYHRRIYEAVKNQDAEEAGRIMREHLEVAYNNLKKIKSEKKIKSDELG
jgi:GntR family transcriptional repressor for pyruvate dehydrogenase complex